MNSALAVICRVDKIIHQWRRAVDNLLRNKEQSRALHEPRFSIMKTDKINGHDADTQQPPAKAGRFE